MLTTRLTRLLHLLGLTRRAATHALRSVRTYMAEGQRARALRSLRLYHNLKADIDRLAADCFVRINQLIHPELADTAN